MKIKSTWITLIAVLIAACSFYLTIQFAQKEATAKAVAKQEQTQRKQDRIILQLRSQNAVLLQQQKDLRTVCLSQQATWDTFQRVIGAATHPPSRAGTTLTADQQFALAEYKQSLIDAVEKRPVCT